MKKLMLILIITFTCSTSFAYLGEERDICQKQCQMNGNSVYKCIQICGY